MIPTIPTHAYVSATALALWAAGSTGQASSAELNAAARAERRKRDEASRERQRELEDLVRAVRAHGPQATTRRPLNHPPKAARLDTAAIYARWNKPLAISREGIKPR